MQRIIKLWVEVDDKGKYSVLYSSKHLERGVLVEGLTKRQVEAVFQLVKSLGHDVVLEGSKSDIADLGIPEAFKVYADEVFKEFHKLQPWEVW